MRIGTRILEIVKKIVIVVFIMVMTLVGWALFERFYFRVAPNQNHADAIKTVKQIHAGELEAKSKYGKYLDLKELVEKELAPQHLIDRASFGFEFEVELAEDDFVIKATAKNKSDSISSITMKSNGKILVTRNYIRSYLY